MNAAKERCTESQLDTEVTPGISEYTRKKRKTQLQAPFKSNSNKFSTEVQMRIKQCKEVMEQNLELHKWRLKREKLLNKKEEILFGRETKQTAFQEERNKLEIQKLKLEVEILKQQLLQ